MWGGGSVGEVGGCGEEGLWVRWDGVWVRWDGVGRRVCG